SDIYTLSLHDALPICNRYLRKAMYMPALSAIKHDERFKMVYHRLVSRNGIKMKACVAVQRRLLELAYILFKTDQLYDKDYHKQRSEEHTSELQSRENI